MPDFPLILTRHQVTKRIYELTRATGRKMKMRSRNWEEKWLPSDYFTLLQVPVDKVEQPMPPHFPALVETKKKDPQKYLQEPIFIDRNRPRITGWKGQTVVVDGKHRYSATKDLRKETIPAYVGVQAIPHFMDENAKGFDVRDRGSGSDGR